MSDTWTVVLASSAGVLLGVILLASTVISARWLSESAASRVVREVKTLLVEAEKNADRRDRRVREGQENAKTAALRSAAETDVKLQAVGNDLRRAMVSLDKRLESLEQTKGEAPKSEKGPG